jgi:hypothetical protein
LTLARLAHGTPVSSFTGSPSMSPRTSTVGPAPFFSTPTTPVLPTFSVTSMPRARSSFATSAAVCVSMNDSSGFACSCL